MRSRILLRWSNVDAGGAYTARTANLSQWAGKTVALRFVSREDSTLQTDFLIDTVSIG
ncbi:hypothetical protein EV193_10280 [Herbihabitans rhizosphaerae]|uniref:Uncharacterized protein n=1 Tax=Herbihabitans rhizosphaerae TaxID=1872711 RepID=A0A4Q7L1W2_9PSEU|nr:hypothetical protein [Herbihabitans rhizosphaerae]RZS43104.1 hypothetical protein EV193_10280 [Herbihabitans rhizosphaerae]